MRKVVLLAALAITGLIAMAPAAEAQTQTFSASFKGNQRLKEPPAPLVCSAGVARSAVSATPPTAPCR
jgi:hypothetical protein